MTRIGDVTVPTVMAQEYMLYSAPNLTLGPNASTVIDIGSYTMPMTGRLSASLLVCCQWSGQIQEVTGVLTDSIPAPAEGFGFDLSLDGIGRTAVITGHVMNRWGVMAAGTGVSLKLRIGVGFFAVNVLVVWAYGWLRSYRTDT